MKRILTVFAACGIGGLALAAATQSPPAAPTNASPANQPVVGKFIAHEWGTFTGFAGSDGVHLPFDTAVGSDLPPFVINRTSQATRQGTKLSINFLLSKGGGIAALQRMETPVIYFYTDKPRDVSVRVDFPRGLLTEFYPPVRAMTPAFGEGPREAGGVASASDDPFGSVPATRPAQPKIDGGSLDWGQVKIIPQRLIHVAGDAVTVRADNIAPVPLENTAARHYEYARETDAAIVRFSDRPGETHDEKFLFYRGLGNFDLPVGLTASIGDQFKLHNTGEQPIPFALLLRNENGRASFAVYRDVRKAQPMELPAESADLSQVGDAITQALIAEGLYEKEASAMVKTWSSSWLAEEGTRVLYIVPRAVTDSLLPLRMTPTPDEIVRVLVGRIDVIMPEQEARIQGMLATAVKSKSDPLSPEDARLLRSLGRFRTAAVDRVAKLRGSPKAQEESDALYRQLRITQQIGQAELK